jgi:hypothetical protein
MLKKHQISSLLLAITLLTGAAFAQSPVAQSRDRQVTPAATTTPVTGSGTLGQITKWISASSIGDSVISEDKNGNVGIGTTAPTAKLTVKGMIQTTLGGLKFPDGTVQATAGLLSVAHNTTLTGFGTSDVPLGVAVPLTLNGMAAFSGVDAVLVVNSTNGKASDFTSMNDLAVNAQSLTNAMWAEATLGTGVFAISHSNNVATAGVDASGAAGGAYAGRFRGNVEITQIADQNQQIEDGNLKVEGNIDTDGTITARGDINAIGTKHFKIDHPLDPENKYLYHASIESSEVLNLYSGNVTSNENGEAEVTLPKWFEAINKDLRYQLTVVGTFAQAIIAQKVKDNRFVIKTNLPNVEVSWQVTGVRSDPVMRQRPFKAEEDKAAADRGYYLSPEAYGQPAEKRIGGTHNAEQQTRLKQQQKAARKANRQ